MGHSRPLFDYFRSFIITISIIQIEKKKRWCARDSNPGPQNSRRRQNHVGCGGHHSVKCLKNWAICGIFFFIFVLFHTVDSTNTFFKWLHSNRWPLVSEATALPIRHNHFCEGVSAAIFVTFRFCYFSECRATNTCRSTTRYFWPSAKSPTATLPSRITWKRTNASQKGPT